MGTYTFIAEYRKGVYIYQVQARTMLRAFRLWVDSFSHSCFIDTDDGNILRNDSKDSDLLPIKIEDTKNVWIWSTVIRRRVFTVHIIKTSTRENSQNLC